MEKRKNTRVPLDIYLNKYVSGVPYLVRAANISRQGVNLAHILEPHGSKQRVGLQFQLPGTEEVIYAEGEVVREWQESKKKEGSSVRFTLLTERHRRLIDAYIERHSSAS
jgi:hypothetical protein